VSTNILVLILIFMGNPLELAGSAQVGITASEVECQAAAAAFMEKYPPPPDSVPFTVCLDTSPFTDALNTTSTTVKPTVDQSF